MAKEVSAIERLSSWVANGRDPNQPIAEYYDVPVTRNTPQGVFRVQIIFGRWMDVGVGFDQEEARENAAEAVIDRMREARTPRIDWERDIKKQKEILERRLFKLAIETKQFGIESINNMMDRIHNNENHIGLFEAIEMFNEVEELFVKFGIKIISDRYEGEKENAMGVTVISEEYLPITVVEFGPNEAANQVKTLYTVLGTIKCRLENEIQNSLMQRNIEKKEQQKRNRSQGSRKGQSRRR